MEIKPDGTMKDILLAAQREDKVVNIILNSGKNYKGSVVHVGDFYMKENRAVIGVENSPRFLRSRRVRRAAISHAVEGASELTFKPNPGLCNDAARMNLFCVGGPLFKGAYTVLLQIGICHFRLKPLPSLQVQKIGVGFSFFQYSITPILKISNLDVH